MTRVVLIGARGSMGRRYAAILRSLSVPHVPFDIETPLAEVIEAVAHADGVIIASPTPTHAAYCRALAPLGRPILCEKPVTTDSNDLQGILQDRRAPFRMMTQYAVLDAPRPGPTLYDFYDSGPDGLAWNCVQLIGLARGSCVLRQQSPVWTCILNGRRLSLQEVSQAYWDYVRLWMQEPEQDRDWIWHAHEAARRWHP